MTQPPEIKYIQSWIPVTDEMLIDMGKASPEVIARYEARRAAAAAAFQALPWYVRFARRQVWWRRHEARSRLSHAWRALRGIECERDW